MGQATNHSRFNWRRVLSATVVPDALRANVIMLQHKRIGALIPVLYFTIAVIAIVAASASGGGFDPVYHLILPCGFVGMGIYRCWVWYSRKSEMIEPEKAEQQLQSTTWIAIIMGLVGGLWTLDAYYDTIEARRILAPVFIFMITFAAAICLNSLPKAAIGAMVGALVPPSIGMIISSDAGIQAMGISLMIVSFLMAGLVVTNFAQMVNGLQLQQELEYLAGTDVLTGLANRRAFTSHLEEQTQNFKEAEERVDFAVLMIDLDGFKGVNDRYGHVAGDELLSEVAERLRKICGHAKSIARLGGDEFALILAVSDEQLLRDQGSAIKAMLSMPYQVDGQQVVISASVGSARYPQKGQKISELLKSADEALYADKAGAKRMDQAAEQ